MTRLLPAYSANMRHAVVLSVSAIIGGHLQGATVFSAIYSAVC